MLFQSQNPAWRGEEKQVILIQALCGTEGESFGIKTHLLFIQTKSSRSWLPGQIWELSLNLLCNGHSCWILNGKTCVIIMQLLSMTRRSDMFGLSRHTRACQKLQSRHCGSLCARVSRWAQEDAGTADIVCPHSAIQKFQFKGELHKDSYCATAAWTKDILAILCMAHKSPFTSTWTKSLKKWKTTF